MRLFEGAEFRRTQLVKDAIESTAVSDEWRHKLRAMGRSVGSA